MRRIKSYRPKTRFAFLTAFILISLLLGLPIAAELGVGYRNTELILVAVTTLPVLLFFTVFLFAVSVKLTEDSLWSLGLTGWKRIRLSDIEVIEVIPLKGGFGTPSERVRIKGPDGAFIRFDSFLGGYRELRRELDSRCHLGLGTPHEPSLG